MRTSHAVVVLIKAPRSGEAKTRLAPLTGADEAAALARCFAVDTLHAICRLDCEIVIAYAPSDGRELLETIVDEAACNVQRVKWVEQEGDDLGARICNALTFAARAGSAPLIAIGTDSPTLPVAYIAEAVRVLQDDDADLALGATEDGGYYLVGVRAPAPELFERIAWSTPLVYSQTIERATELGLRVSALAEWFDVDTPDDLRRLDTQLRSDKVIAAQARATAGWLENHRELLNALTDE